MATLIHDALVSERINVWMAGSLNGGVTGGNAYKEDIVKAVYGCRIFILVYSEHVNSSRDVKNELSLAEGKVIVPVRVDMSEMAPELLYDLKRLEYIDATGTNQSVFLYRLITEVKKQLQQSPQSEKQRTDMMLFRRGITLLYAGQYQSAASVLEQYCSIVPENAAGWYYLVISMIGNCRIHKLDGLLVADMERKLVPFVRSNKHPRINYLLALLKSGYYHFNKLREPEPVVQVLLKDVVLSREEASELLELIPAFPDPVRKRIEFFQTQNQN